MALLTPPIKIALVNNMPDGAFVDTERQFRAMLSSGLAAGAQLALYTITEIPRSEATTAVIQERYHGLDELWTNPPHALIVTGTEPTQAQMRYERHWPYLVRLLEWAAESVPTVLLSCLAAHASILLFDGIDRVRRQSKCCGVFDGLVAHDADRLADGLPNWMPLPHSRLNYVPEAPLIDAGYQIVVGGGDADVGWAVATREYRGALFVLCQAHPEYGKLSLLREYRRDVRRYLFGGCATPYPSMPAGYFSLRAVERLEEFAWCATATATATRRDPRELWAGFPYEEVADTVQNRWADGAAVLYANWIQGLRSGSLVKA